MGRKWIRYIVQIIESYGTGNIIFYNYQVHLNNVDKIKRYRTVLKQLEMKIYPIALNVKYI